MGRYNDEVAKITSKEGGITACVAHGCPLLGTIQAGHGWVCRFHHEATVVEWQGVTRDIREGKIDTRTPQDRINQQTKNDVANVRREREALGMTGRQYFEYRLKAMGGIKNIFKGASKDWALKLKQRHEDGEHLEEIQIYFYQEALKVRKNKNEPA